MSYLANLHPPPTSIKVSLSAVAGLLSHTFLFIRGEWHLQAPFLFRLYLILALVLLLLEWEFSGSDSFQALTTWFLEILAYIAALFGSIFIYRTSLHRLRGYPGPYLARVSSLWHSWQVRNSKNHLFLDRMRDKYGEFVRTGSSTALF
jgi:hypothetical protein